jgi:hypothetical protein
MHWQPQINEPLDPIMIEDRLGGGPDFRLAFEMVAVELGRQLLQF